MNIVVSSDSNYLKYLKVLMASVYLNHIEIPEINFYILHSGLSECDQQAVRDFASKYNQFAYFIDVDETKYESLLNCFTYNRWSPATMFILFIHELLPDTIDRALYLDIDVVCNGDITEFYNLDFGECFLIASKTRYNVKDEPTEPFQQIDRVSDYDLTKAKSGSYFNSGAVLFNLKKFRESNINVEFYINKIKGVQNIFMDQGMLNLCFAKETLLLTTCQYNYRLHFSAMNYFDRENNYVHGKVQYTFYPMHARIIHYCGDLPGASIKPWTFVFERNNDIVNPRKEYFDLIPECIPYFNVWWNYAKLTPDYSDLYLNARINTAAYQMVKKITLEKNQEFCNQLGLESYYVPTARKGANYINKEDDLNKYTRPNVYRCASAEIKATIKNLPKEYTEKCGFRLIVKHIHSNGKTDSNTSTIQIIELNHSSAMIYRRYCGNPEKGTWGKWYPISSNKELETIKNSKSWKITAPLRKLVKVLRKLKKKVK